MKKSRNTPLRVMCVFGTRPEAIKMAPVVRSLRKRPKDFNTSVVVTGQHREMLDQVLELFEIPADHDLNVMQHNQSLEYVVARVLTDLSALIDREQPDLVLVHGDTVTAFAAALAAFYKKVPIGHVEAGLRSFDKLNPFPEESSRVLADAIATLHFAPTHQAKKNLLKEHIAPDRIFVTGNTVTDALFIALKQPHQWRNETLRALFDPACRQAGPASGRSASRPASRLILVTAHRRENHGQPLENVMRALRRIVDKHPGVYVIYPVHLNPNVQKTADAVLRGHDRIHLIPPVDYLDLVNLLKKSYLVVTDSGGIQEEAPALGKPVLVLRKVTERPEAVAAGTAQVVGVEEGAVFKHIERLLTSARAYRAMAEAVNPYGDGKATLRILDAIRYHFGIWKEKPAEFKGDLR